MEYLTYPYKTGNTEKVNVFFEFLSDCEIKTYPVDITIAKKAARIRALYKNFKTMDCLQPAAAWLEQCYLFLTNDKQLRQFDEMKCITIKDF